MNGADGTDVLFDGLASVDYGSFELAPADAWEDSGDEFRNGAVNGLMAVGDPGSLFLMTGTYYCHVPVRVSLHWDAPPIEDSWWTSSKRPGRPTAATSFC